MMAPNSRLVEGKKFFWDGRIYSSRHDADTAQAAYEHDGFETSTSAGERMFLVYTRRVVRQVIEVKAN